MSDTDELKILSEILALEDSSFVRYIVEAGATETRDDADRRAMAFYEEWADWSRRKREALGSLLAREGVFPVERQYPLTYSLFNYLGAAFLLRHVIEKTGAHLEELERLAGGAALRAEARSLVDGMVKREREYLERARKLEDERPRAPHGSPRPKGTSAAWW